MIQKSLSYKRAVVLGAAGFIGTNLVHALVEQDYEVICFDRQISPDWPQGVKAIIGEFANYPSELILELDHTLIFHLVSSCRPSNSTERAIDEISLDLQNTIRYLEFTKSKDVRWVFISSGGTVYGRTEVDTISEDHPTNPICTYGVVKLAIEKYFAIYRTLHALDFVVVRLANPYGHGQIPGRGQGIIATLLDKAIKGEQIEIWGDGEQVRDYIYIIDAVKGVISSALFGSSGETYNVGTGKGTSVNQLIHMIEITMMLKVHVEYSPARTVDVKSNILNINKLSSQVGWMPKIEISSGIAMTGSWMSGNVQ